VAWVKPQNFEEVDCPLSPKAPPITEPKTKDHLRIPLDLDKAILSLVDNDVGIHVVVHFMPRARRKRVNFTPGQPLPLL
jgi:hypothetical protein